MTFPNNLITVSPVSTILTVILLFTLPMAGFFVGLYYQKRPIEHLQINTSVPSTKDKPTNQNYPTPYLSPGLLNNNELNSSDSEQLFTISQDGSTGWKVFTKKLFHKGKVA
jgi:hypothetical protein